MGCAWPAGARPEPRDATQATLPPHPRVSQAEHAAEREHKPRAEPAERGAVYAMRERALGDGELYEARLQERMRLQVIRGVQAQLDMDLARRCELTRATMKCCPQTSARCGKAKVIPPGHASGPPRTHGGRL